MEFAKSIETGERITAAPDQHATCPACHSPVIPKRGDIRIWHWAHKAHADCDSWSEPESEWHRRWKEYVPPEKREVVIGSHRADIVTPDGTVVELQHSPISPTGIKDRETAYGRMAWLFDASPFRGVRVIPAGPSPDPDAYPEGVPCVLEWSRSKEYIREVSAPCWLDIGHLVPRHVLKIVRHTEGAIMGLLVPNRNFISQVLLRTAPPPERKMKVARVIAVAPSHALDHSDLTADMLSFSRRLQEVKGDRWAIRTEPPDLHGCREAEAEAFLSFRGADVSVVYMGEYKGTEILNTGVQSELTCLLDHSGGTPVFIRSGGRWLIPEPASDTFGGYRYRVWTRQMTQ